MDFYSPISHFPTPIFCVATVAILKMMMVAVLKMVMALYQSFTVIESDKISKVTNCYCVHYEQTYKNLP